MHHLNQAPEITAETVWFLSVSSVTSCGIHSVHSTAHAETFHPVIGPVAEAEALYVRQLNLCQRRELTPEPFVLWDVGLGAAANALTVLGSLRHLTVHLADFPDLIQSATAESFPKPHAILYDPFSPAKNPAMWTLPVFRRIYRLLDPARPCALPTYSRSTLLRVTLLQAGFYVGAGHATGEKEETTIAANSRSLITEPLDRTWLERVRRSTSAEPLTEPAYRQAPLSPATWNQLMAHPQFC